MLDFIRVTGSRSRSVFFALFVGFSAISIYAVNAAFTRTDSIRLSPVQVTVTPEVGLPGDVKDLEVQSLGLGFDRDTSTQYVAYGQSLLEVNLDKVSEIHTLKVFGAAPYDISVKALVNGQWQAVDGLIDLDLSSLTPFWHSFSVTSSVTTNLLQINIKSSTGGSATGLKELEIWGQSERVTVNTGANLLDTIQTDNTAPQARFYSASQSEAIIGNVENLDDQTSDNSFTVQLDRDPRTIKRAWLSYESHAAGHWVSVVRDVNGLGDLGGSYRFASSAWSGQLEQINPHWLVQGSNTISFKVIDDNSYRIRNLGLLIETDDGSNYIETDTITAFPVSDSNTALAAHDGNNLSGWAPYDGAAPNKAQRYLQFDFDKLVQLDGIAINLNNSLKGKIEVEFLENGEWQNAGIGAILGQDLVEGWNTIAVDRKVFIEGMKLVFENGNGSKAEIIEVAPVGSGVGATQSPARIDVTYPDAGQYHGDAAYIRGFVQPMDNGSGTAQVFVAGREVTRSDAAFETLVNKTDFTVEDTGYSVTVDALYPDGTKVTEKVYLIDGLDAANDLMQTYAADGEIDSSTNNESLTSDNPGTRHNPQDCYFIEHDESALNICKAALEENESPSDIKISSLKQDDLPPLNPGMTNVTSGPRHGYRFNPHGKKFKTNVEVIVPFDESRIPAGLSVQDIRTWYFDDELGRWVALEKVEVDKKSKKVKSNTDHFTDMINATLTVPENPEAASFNPTQIKDIKAADPGAGINLIEPPQANNNGSANLSYPIEIPAGRNGMQPQLGVQYNSSGGNGWLGLGWDLSVPSISVETRWGVPRYDTGNETESYLLNGQQMTPLAHRGELKSRQSNKDDFKLRVEGSFQNIKRHGSSPSTYWWEVTDKNGTKNFYGGDGSKQVDYAVIGGLEGIFQWKLVKTVDTNGNTIEYEYDTVCDTGTGSGNCASGVKGYQIYLSAINYTGHTSGTAPYRVEFVRDKDAGLPRRPDIIVDARGGFKQVTSELLKEIKVLYNQSIVRSYTLNYQEGAFKKTLLKTIIQKDKDGTEFNRHELDYYDEVTKTASKVDLFDSVKPINAGTDNLKESLLGVVKYPSTLVGGSSGLGASGNGYAGIGFPLIGNYLHAAVAVKASANRSDTQIMLIDIDGDGLQDKVFEDHGQVVYRRNTTNVETDIVSFSTEEPLTVRNISRLSKNRSTSWAKGVKAKAFIINGYADSSKSVTTDDIYFSDINGDGLVDQVSSGNVNFNYISNTGTPAFSAYSDDTEAPINPGAVNADVLLADMVNEREALENDNPLMDAIRRWKAPYTGKIKITSTAQLHDFNNDPSLTEEQRDAREEYEHADGVRLSIQHNNQLKQSVEVGGEKGDNYDPTTINIAAFNVSKGDTIYFRTHSKYDGNYDQVEWNPSINYVSNTGAGLTHIDANLLNSYSFNANDDFVLGGREVSVALPNFGTVELKGILNKTAITSDDIDIAVTVYDVIDDGNGGVVKTKVESLSFTDKLTANTKDRINFDRTFDVKKDQEFIFSVTSDSTIDLRSLSWENNEYPSLTYIKAYEPAHDLLYQPVNADATDETSIPGSIDDLTLSEDNLTESAGSSPEHDIPVTDDSGKPTIVVPVSVNTDIYSGNTLNGSPQKAWVPENSGVVLITPWISLKHHEDIECRPYRAKNIACEEGVWAPDGTITFTVKNNGRLLAKSTIEIKDKKVVQETQGYDALFAVPVVKGERYFLDFSIKNPRLASEIQSSEINYGYGSDIGWKPPFAEDVNFKTTLRGNLPDHDGDSISRQLMILVRNDSEIIYRKLATFTGTSIATVIDEYQLSVDSAKEYYFDFFTVSQDFNIYEKSVWANYSGEASYFVAPKEGPVHITPKLQFTNNTIDGNIELRVSQNNGGWHRRTYSVVNGVIPEASLIPIELDLRKNDTLRFEYVTSNHSLSTYLKTKGDIRIDYVDRTNWNVPEEWTGNSSSVELSIQPELTFNQSSNNLNGDFIYRVWHSNQLLLETNINVANGQINYPTNLPVKLTALDGNELSFEFSTSNQELLDALNKARTNINSASRNISLATITNIIELNHKPFALRVLMPSKFDNHVIHEDTERHFTIDDILYGNPNRGWGYIGYYANAPYSGELIDTARLRLKTEAELRDTDSIDTIYLTLPNVSNRRWNSIDPNWWINGSSMSSSRLGLDEIWVPDAADYNTAGARNVVRIPRRSAGKTYAYGGGADFFTVNYSKGRSTGELELIDLNGDRFPDIVGSGHVQYTLPTGEMGETSDVLSSTNTTRNDNQSYSTGPASGYASVLSAAAKAYELGNKEPNAPAQHNLSYFNVGLSASIGKGDSEAEIQMSDINGDGLPDRIHQSGSSIYVQLNMGYSFTSKELWGTAKINDSLNQNVGLSSLSYSVNGGSRQLKDMNGDGLADYVELRDDNTVWVSFNTGAGFSSAVLVEGLLSTTGEIPGVSSIPGFESKQLLYDGASLSVSQSIFNYSGKFTIWATFVPVLDIVWGGGASVSATMSQPTLGFNDLNGDGKIDGIQSKNDSSANVVINATRYTNMLKSVTRPQGAAFKIDYKRVGNTYDLPQSMWVMSQVVMFDGAGSDTPDADKHLGSDYKVFIYDYLNGKHDRFEREFLGFETVENNELATSNVHANINDKLEDLFSTARLSDLFKVEEGEGTNKILINRPPFRKSIQTYLNESFYTKGLMTESQTLGREKTDGSGNLVLYRKSENKYVLRPLGDNAGAELDDLSNSTQADALKVYRDLGAPIFPYLNITKQFFHEGGSEFKSTYTENKYDEYGNVTLFTDFGDEGDDDDVTADIKYSHEYGDCRSLYIVGKPTSITVSNHDGEMLRKRVGSYYCENGNGNLKTIHQYINDSDIAVTTMDEYDQYGNLKQISAPLNNASHEISGTARSLVMKYDYDVNATNTYPVRVENVSYGLESKAIYDYKFGKLLCTMDTNGNPLRYRYDSLGRTTRIIGPYEQAQACDSSIDNGAVDTASTSASGPFTIRFSYQPGGNVSNTHAAEISMAKTEHYNRDASANALDTIDTWLFTDGMKRVLQTKKTASIDKGDSVEPDRIVSGRISFDALGRSIRQYYPSLDGSNAANAFNDGYDSFATQITYDALDRNKSTILPDSSETTIDYGFGGFNKGTLGNYFTTTVTDAETKQKVTYRDVRELIHAVNEEGGIITRYAYDPLKQIRHVWDAEDNHTEVGYDLLGRRTSINNPDTGNTEYKYDLAGNLIEKLTANRENQNGIQYFYDHTRLIDIRYPTFAANDVHYVYGTSSDKAKNQAGRIKQVDHQSGTELREYGKLGEIVREQFTVSAVRNGQVPTYTTRYEFDTFGRLMNLQYPSGEVLTHEYDRGGNLSKIIGKFQGADYEYLKTLTYDKFEQRVFMVLGNGIKTRYTYRDDNRRLEYLNSTGDVAGVFQNNKYTYDDVGNITLLENKVQIPRNSQPGGPTVQNYRYDDLHRLVYADGKFSADQNRHHFYQLDMEYDNIHNITRKNQLHKYGRDLDTARDQRQTTYDWTYGYDIQNEDAKAGPHAPTRIDTRDFHYDANGNQTGWNSTVSGQRRTIVWDDENRIQEINDPGNTAWYAYNDQGQRKIKRGRYGETVYVNQFLTVRDGALATMHVYAGNSRVVSKLKPGKPIGRDKFNTALSTNSDGTTETTSSISNSTTGTTTTSTSSVSTTISSSSVTKTNNGNGNGNANGHSNNNGNANGHSNNHPGQGLEHRSDRANEVAQNTVKNPHLIDLDSGDTGGDIGGGDTGTGDDGSGTTLADIAYDFTGGAEFLYYYHPDHLGSTGYVTDKDGEIYEHIEYFPFGETWVLEGTSNWKVPYMYTSKELDEDTQLYYYGARYYDPRTSVWQSADPILGDYLDGKINDGVQNSSNLAMYSYTYNNPIKYNDPDGRFADVLDTLVLRSHISGGGVQRHRPKGSTFGLVRNNNTKRHNGLDLRAITGTPVYSMGNGTVIKTGTHSQLGNYVVNKFKYKYSFWNFIKDVFSPSEWGKIGDRIENSGKDYYMLSAHLDSFASGVSDGESLSEGEKLGETGTTGNASSNPDSESHGHIGIYKNWNGISNINPSDRVDPLDLIQGVNTTPKDNRSSNPENWE